jgi:hypothetical protein
VAIGIGQKEETIIILVNVVPINGLRLASKWRRNGKKRDLKLWRKRNEE